MKKALIHTNNKYPKIYAFSIWIRGKDMKSPPVIMSFSYSGLEKKWRIHSSITNRKADAPEISKQAIRAICTYAEDI